MAVLLLLAVGLSIRLAQGPVPLDFLRATVQNKINQSLPGMTVTVGGVTLQRTGSGAVPHVLLANLRLDDKQGNYLASAPHASLEIDKVALLTGRVVPTAITLIGPRIRARRDLDGTFALGFDNPTPESEAVTVDAGEDGKADLEPGASGVAPPKFNGSGAPLIDLVSGGPGATGMGSIDAINIDGATISFYDEANDANWAIRNADLSFKRQQDGFKVEANASVLNGDRSGGSWTAGGSASYRRDTHSFLVSAHVTDVSPAKISSQIYAFSKLARVDVPLSGRVDMEMTDTGLVTRAAGEFTAAAGVVELPEYLAGKINVDEGSLRAEYDPVTGSIAITDSALLIGSSHAQMTGRLSPERSADGRLTAIGISLGARNAAIDAQGSIRDPVTIDQVIFQGRAGIEEARVDIGDLQVISGNAVVRLTGAIAGGNESPAISMAGRVQRMPAALLKRLWPPIIAERTRAFVNANVQDGVITDGEFKVVLPADAIAEAKRTRKLPPGSVRMNMKMEGVSSGYFRKLPPLQNAAGEANLADNEFSLKIEGADIVLPSGAKGRLASGAMFVRDILAAETMSDFDLDIAAGAQALIEYLDQPDLGLIRHTGIDTSKLEGDATMKVHLAFPMIKPLPPGRIEVKAAAKLKNAALRDALPGFDVTEGKIDLVMDKGVLTASGPARIAGIPVEILWERGAAPGFVQSAVIKTTLDGEQRRKLGIDLGTFVRGPIGVTATLDNLADPQGKVEIDAGLDEAEMRIQQIGWARPAVPKTTAKLTYYSKGDKAPRVENLEIKGTDLSIKGSMLLAPNRQGLRSASFTEMKLSDENRFAANVKVSGDNVMDVQVTGDSFDARPLIRGLFGNRNRDEAAQAAQQAKANSGRTVRIDLTVGRVYAYMGEIITSVSGTLTSQSSRLTHAEINGTFLSGQPIVFRMTPVDGGREMRINGRDGGAAIRAANLYSKVAGGQIEFYALLGREGSVRNGKLVLRDFEVRNEAALAELDARGKPKRDAPRRDGPRRDALSFKKLSLPFTSDSRFICIGEALVRGPELGASAAGLIRKSDGAIDIAGTITPAYALNAALGDIPLLGDIITGGKGQGIIGVTFAMGGTVDKPDFQMNPVSAMAPGFLRKFFEYSSRCEPMKPVKKTGKNAGEAVSPAQ
ncbi:MAG: hypothetical protein IOC82_17005 [Aestuariivirga sp.]|uniref:YhdP family protein n=1 Tax=Aestuariivirga sp. TaxID=2650926 RepID=UPI0025B7EF94|nr:DUF3971 domain-containing protein [Aestuariivirga sp.]MCA3562706.1 hypothetical protein [Aestuariivirga sp.]